MKKLIAALLAILSAITIYEPVFADKVDDIINEFTKERKEIEDLNKRVPIICITRDVPMHDGTSYTVSMPRERCNDFRKKLSADPEVTAAIRKLRDAGVKIFVEAAYTGFRSEKYNTLIEKTKNGIFVTDGISLFLVKSYFGLTK